MAYRRGQTSAIAALDGRLTTKRPRPAAARRHLRPSGRAGRERRGHAVQTGAIAGLRTDLAANAQRDDVQDQRLAYHDVLLGEHDTRIARAQGSADTALAAVGTLRGDVDAGRAGMVRVTAAGNLAVGGSAGGTSVSFTGSAGDRRLSGVADGIAANDAATVGQMTAGNAATLVAANTIPTTRSPA